MATSQQIETRKAILKARGVPERFIDAIANRAGNSGIMLVVVILALVMFGLQMSGLFLSEHIEPWVLRHYAGATSSVLFYAPSSLGMLGFMVTIALGFLLAFAIMMAWASRPVRPFPQYNSYAVRLRMLRPDESLATIEPNRRYDEYATLADDAAFLAAIAPKPSSVLVSLSPLIIIVIVIAGYLAPTALAATHYKAVTMDEIDIYSGANKATYRLSEAKYAYVVCYDGVDRGGFAYRLAYADTSIELWERRDALQGLGPAEVLDRLDSLDQRLAQLGVPIHRMPVTGSPYDDGMNCVVSRARAWRLKRPDVLHRLVFGN